MNALTNRKFVIIGLLLLVVGVVAAVFVSQQRQDVRQRAAIEQPSLYLSTTNTASTQPVTIAVGEQKTINLYLDDQFGNIFTAFDITIDPGTAIQHLSVVGPTPGVDASKFDNEAFKTYDPATSKMRYAKLISSGNTTPIMGKLLLATIQVTGTTVGTGTINIGTTALAAAGQRAGLSPLKVPFNYTVVASNSPTPSPTPTILSSLTGIVFTDANANGVKDANEVVFGGPSGSVTVSLSGDPTLKSPVETNNGNYSFTNLRNGNYFVTISLPANFAVTTNNNPASTPVSQNTVVNFGLTSTTPPANLSAACKNMFTRVLASYGTVCGNQTYDPLADIDKNGVVSLRDYTFMLAIANGTNSQALCQDYLDNTLNACVSGTATPTPSAQPTATNTPIPPTATATSVPPTATPTTFASTITPTTFVLTADIDRNGCIDLRDYNNWLSAFITAPTPFPTNIFPDVDGADGVTIVDFNIWLSAFRADDHACS